MGGRGEHPERHLLWEALGCSGVCAKWMPTFSPRLTGSVCLMVVGLWLAVTLVPDPPRSDAFWGEHVYHLCSARPLPMVSFDRGIGTLSHHLSPLPRPHFHPSPL